MTRYARTRKDTTRQDENKAKAKHIDDTTRQRQRQGHVKKSLTLIYRGGLGLGQGEG